ILLTTHDLGDIERLCHRIMIIDHGRLAYDGDLDQLRATVAADRLLIVDLARPGPDLDLPGVRVVRRDGPRQWLALPPGANAATVVAALADRHEIADIALREADIEDIITRLYRTGLPASR
ncbi:methionine ABC transporter ATP-binding protein, partial [Actinomadura sp. HBU206391]|nr:methionine ABC transporter ATP-binding protein [Actinomadura sp. HBU206391]